MEEVDNLDGSKSMPLTLGNLSDFVSYQEEETLQVLYPQSFQFSRVQTVTIPSLFFCTMYR